MGDLNKDFETEKKRVRKLAVTTVIIFLISIILFSILYVNHYRNIGLFFGITSGLTFEFLFVVGAERLEINSLKSQ
jgi:hypothetical protein